MVDPEQLSPVGETNGLQEVRAGDEAAWAALVRRYEPMIIGLTRRYRLNPSDAEDVSQTVWLRLFEHLDQLRDDQALPGWLATTTTRVCLTLLRRQGRSIVIDPEDLSASKSRIVIGKQEGDSSAIDSDLRRHELGCAVEEGLAELTSRQRDMMRLLVTEPPLPYVEISAQMGVPVGSIGPTRARCLRKLRATSSIQRLMTVDGSPVPFPAVA